MANTIDVPSPPPRPLVSLRRLEELVGRGRGDLERLASSAGRFYQPFDLFQHKGQGRGKWRHIDNPTDTLKTVQRSIQRRILASCALPSHMFGGVSGKSIRDNARVHIGQPELVTLDLADCFPNIDNRRVFAAFRDHFGASTQIASLLTRLTTFQRRLPQGAPTSPVLANIVMLSLYEAVEVLCADAGLNVSFFVDDIAVSGAGAWKVIDQITRLVAEHGFCVAARKVEVMANDERQALTGTVVNRKVSAGLKYFRSTRDEIYRVAHLARPTEQHLQRLRGRISHVKHVCPEQGRALQRYFDRWQPASPLTDDGPRKKGFAHRPCSSFDRSTHDDVVAPT